LALTSFGGVKKNGCAEKIIERDAWAWHEGNAAPPLATLRIK
jgi:hypothetical protein